jgi:hypothetical protein
MESFFLDKDVSFCFCFFFYYYIYGSLVEKKLGIIIIKKHTLTSTVELIGPSSFTGGVDFEGCAKRAEFVRVDRVAW